MNLTTQDFHPPKRLEDMTPQELAIAAYAFELGQDAGRSQYWDGEHVTFGDDLTDWRSGSANPYLGEH